MVDRFSSLEASRMYEILFGPERWHATAIATTAGCQARLPVASDIKIIEINMPSDFLDDIEGARDA